jgi:hypothetical protein
MRRLSAVILLCVWGCSSGVKGPPLFPVTGTLTVGGKPLANVSVQLMPVDVSVESKSRPGGGMTNADGKFTIQTNGADGAQAGKYKVVLLASSGAPTGQMSVEEATKMSGQFAGSRGPAPATSPFPKEWESAATSPKEIEVTNEPVTVKIEI